MSVKKFTSVDAYIASFPLPVQQCLLLIRGIVRTEAPEALETIKYNMPCYVLHGNLVYFAAFQSHIGFYSIEPGNEEIAHALKGYKTGRGSVQFPYSLPMPAHLIALVVRHRVAGNMAKAQKAGVL